MARRILILESDPEAQCVLGRFLARSGYSVAYASDGDDAAAEVRKSRYDLFLLDVAEGDGLQALAFLRELRDGGRTSLRVPPVLLLTSDAPGDPAPSPRFGGVKGTVNKRSRNFFDQLLDEISHALRNGSHPAGPAGR